MRILLDECIDVRFARLIPHHSVRTVVAEGFSGFHNGKLLKAIAGRFDVFVTIDKNIPFQQATAELEFTVIVLRPLSSPLTDLEPFAARIVQQLEGGTTSNPVILA